MPLMMVERRDPISANYDRIQTKMSIRSKN